MGFKCGNFVVITQSENAITITALPEVKEKEPAVKKNYRKAKPVFSPELDALSGKELFTALSDEEYHAYLTKKGRRKNTQQAAEPDNNIIRLHPEQSQAADGTDYFTIA